MSSSERSLSSTFLRSVVTIGLALLVGFAIKTYLSSESYKKRLVDLVLGSVDGKSPVQLEIERVEVFFRRGYVPAFGFRLLGVKGVGSLSSCPQYEIEISANEVLIGALPWTQLSAKLDAAQVFIPFDLTEQCLSLGHLRQWELPMAETISLLGPLGLVGKVGGQKLEPFDLEIKKLNLISGSESSEVMNFRFQHSARRTEVKLILRALFNQALVVDSSVESGLQTFKLSGRVQEGQLRALGAFNLEAQSGSVQVFAQHVPLSEIRKWKWLDKRLPPQDKVGDWWFSCEMGVGALSMLASSPRDAQVSFTKGCRLKGENGVIELADSVTNTNLQNLENETFFLELKDLPLRILAGALGQTFDSPYVISLGQLSGRFQRLTSQKSQIQGHLRGTDFLIKRGSVRALERLNSVRLEANFDQQGFQIELSEFELEKPARASGRLVLRGQGAEIQNFDVNLEDVVLSQQTQNVIWMGELGSLAIKGNEKSLILRLDKSSGNYAELEKLELTVANSLKSGARDLAFHAKGVRFPKGSEFGQKIEELKGGLGATGLSADLLNWVALKGSLKWDPLSGSVKFPSLKISLDKQKVVTAKGGWNENGLLLMEFKGQALGKNPVRLKGLRSAPEWSFEKQ